MQRWNDLTAVPAGFGPSVVTIGNFDGVHRGHQAVLAQVTGIARARSAKAVAVTFDPHPAMVLFPERAPAPICGLDTRLTRMAATGLDATLVLPFTREFADWEPERFVRDVLVGALHTCVVVVGRDTRFGRRNSGDVQTLRDLGAELGFDVEILPDLADTPVDLSDVAGPGAEDDLGPRRWSSSWIRELIAAGDVEGAEHLLGTQHSLIGTVVHGDHRGRELGFPTANLSQDAQGLIPVDGVYAGWLTQLDLPEGDPQRRLPAAISVGTNPTFDGTQRRVESYVLDRTDLDLYGHPVEVTFVRLLRPTLRFDGIEALIEQMAEDVEDTRAALGVPAVG